MNADRLKLCREVAHIVGMIQSNPGAFDEDSLAEALYKIVTPEESAPFPATETHAVRAPSVFAEAVRKLMNQKARVGSYIVFSDFYLAGRTGLNTNQVLDGLKALEAVNEVEQTLAGAWRLTRLTPSRPEPEDTCPCCGRSILEIQGEAPCAVETWICSDCYDSSPTGPALDRYEKALNEIARLDTGSIHGKIAREALVPLTPADQETPLDALLKKLRHALAEGSRELYPPTDLAAEVAKALQAEGWVVLVGGQLNGGTYMRVYKPARVMVGDVEHKPGASAVEEVQPWKGSVADFKLDASKSVLHPSHVLDREPYQPPYCTRCAKDSGLGTACEGSEGSHSPRNGRCIGCAFCKPDMYCQCPDCGRFAKILPDGTLHMHPKKYPGWGECPNKQAPKDQKPLTGQELDAKLKEEAAAQKLEASPMKALADAVRKVLKANPGWGYEGDGRLPVAAIAELAKLSLVEAAAGLAWLGTEVECVDFPLKSCARPGLTASCWRLRKEIP